MIIYIYYDRATIKNICTIVAIITVGVAIITAYLILYDLH